MEDFFFPTFICFFTLRKTAKYEGKWLTKIAEQSHVLKKPIVCSVVLVNSVNFLPNHHFLLLFLHIL